MRHEAVGCGMEECWLCGSVTLAEELASRAHERGVRELDEIARQMQEREEAMADGEWAFFERALDRAREGSEAEMVRELRDKKGDLTWKQFELVRDIGRREG